MALRRGALLIVVIVAHDDSTGIKFSKLPEARRRRRNIAFAELYACELCDGVSHTYLI